MVCLQMNRGWSLRTYAGKTRADIPVIMVWIWDWDWDQIKFMPNFREYQPGKLRDDVAARYR